MVSAHSMAEGQLENALKIHLSRKSEEIDEGQWPGTERNSGYSMKQTSPLSEKVARLKNKNRERERSFPPSEVEDSP